MASAKIPALRRQIAPEAVHVADRPITNCGLQLFVDGTTKAEKLKMPSKTSIKIRMETCSFI
ncbi:hypothetical protein SDJN02_11453, partial [Cucurbita argyrosperma subsp. argyrosperma]